MTAPTLPGSPAAVLVRRGERVLYGAFAVLFAVLLWSAIVAPETVWVTPLVLLVLLVGLFAARDRTRLFLMITCGYFLISSYDERGLGVLEVLYGLVSMGYLSLYVGVRMLSAPARLVQTSSEAGLLFFVVWSLFSMAWAPIYGARLPEMLGDLSGVMMLLFYFPARDLASRSRRGAYAVAGVVLFIGLAATLRNIFNYRAIILSAVMEWQQNLGRVTTNEVFLVFSGLLLLALAAAAERPRVRHLALILVPLPVAALVITQSRAFWVDFAFGVLLLMIRLQGPARRRVLVTTSLGVACVSAAVVVMFPTAIDAIVSGLLHRVSSLGSAATTDISLRGRFYETAAVWRLIQQNPALGHGLAAPVFFYEIISDVTLRRPFMHNGYVGLLFKGGLIGTLPLLFSLGAFIVRAWRLRVDRLPPGLRALGAFCGPALVAILPSSATSIHFYLADTMLMTALAAGLAAGLWAHAPPPPDADAA
jgi:O-antigen ligase